jgi:membrane protease YdiL (CAAX protease family)
MCASTQRERVVPASLALIIYVSLRWIWPQILDSLHTYGGYAFEALFVISVLSYFRESSPAVPARRIIRTRVALSSILVFAGGLACSQAAIANAILIPFDLQDRVNLILLLAIGPVLEEFIFRGALWRLIQHILDHDTGVVLITSAAFSLSHLLVYWHVPEEFRAFVLFQTSYTVLLGLFCGQYRRSTGSPALPILLHGLFNLGFYAGTLI